MQSLESINQEEFSVAIPAALNSILANHLIRLDGQEDVAFALYKPSFGKNRFTGLVHEIILPDEEERDVHGNVDIMPEYFKRACQTAVKEKSGLVFMHSHPYPGWQGMSKPDIKTESGYAPTVLTLTNLPIIGMTVGSDQIWSARIWKYEHGSYFKNWASTVRVVGKSLKVSFNDQLRPIPEFKEIFKRTFTFWGEKNHAHIARLRIGIIGLGSVGSIVGESLARMGIQRPVMVDFDEVQEHNLDRLLGTTRDDIGQLKIYVAKRQFEKASTASNIQILTSPSPITEEAGYRQALDCDILISCVDRPWPRHVLNHIAYNHLIPVIDGGIRVRLNPKTLLFEGAEWQLQTVGPERICLQCLGVYNPSHVNTEREGLLEDQTYMDTLPANHDLKRNENIFPLSANLASLEIMQLIKVATDIADPDFGTQRYVFNTGHIRLSDDHLCQEGCLFNYAIATGDTLFPSPYGFDHSANIARKRQDSKET
jgi:molybdopterin-synthase adenylyltransferase